MPQPPPPVPGTPWSIPTALGTSNAGVEGHACTTEAVVGGGRHLSSTTGPVPVGRAKAIHHGRFVCQGCCQALPQDPSSPVLIIGRVTRLRVRVIIIEVVAGQGVLGRVVDTCRVAGQG